MCTAGLQANAPFVLLYGAFLLYAACVTARDAHQLLQWTPLQFALSCCSIGYLIHTFLGTVRELMEIYACGLASSPSLA